VEKSSTQKLVKTSFWNFSFNSFFQKLIKFHEQTIFLISFWKQLIIIYENGSLIFRMKIKFSGDAEVEKERKSQ